MKRQGVNERTVRGAVSLPQRWEALQGAIAGCGRCARLRRHCESVATVKRAAYREWTYWGKPVPNFGPGATGDGTGARLLILGLAPGAHGANRTGRMFTGDRSGDFLFEAMHATGFANQARCERVGDGLELVDCVITATCHCAPPDNKPLPEEIAACRPFLEETFALMPRLRGVLALGKIGWDAGVKEFRGRGWVSEGERVPAFAHGAEYVGTGGTFLLGTYHPSQQNTFTGRLTQGMLRAVFERARELMGSA